MTNNGKIVSALLIGAAAGAALGVLFAPDKGATTRTKIADKTKDLVDQLQSKIDEGKEAISHLRDKAMNKADDLKHKAEDLKQKASYKASEYAAEAGVRNPLSNSRT